VSEKEETLTDINTVDSTRVLATADDVLRISLDIGAGLLKSGAEIRRVEIAIDTVAKAYGAEHIEVFSINSLIIASVRMPDNTYSSQNRRILKNITPDFTTLEKYNALSRKLCAETPSPKVADELIKNIKNTPKNRIYIHILGYMLVSGGFALFFGGSMRDAIAGALAGLVLALLDRIRFDHATQLLKTLFLAFCGGMLSHLVVIIGLGQNLDSIIIGTIMLMIPGMALGNAMRDLFGGDLLSGTLKIVQACMIAVAIVIGYALSIMLLGGALQ
jgi:uncharacterized membrane protein YjjP (DUF1212 family)